MPDLGTYLKTIDNFLVATAGTRRQVITTFTAGEWVLFQARRANTGAVWIGDSTVLNTGLAGIELPKPAAGQVLPFLCLATAGDQFDLAELYVDVEVSGEGLNILYLQVPGITQKQGSFIKSVNNFTIDAPPTAEQLIATATFAEWALIQAKRANTGRLHVGVSGVGNDGLSGMELPKPRALQVLPHLVLGTRGGQLDLSEIYINAVAAGEGVNALYLEVPQS